MKTCTVCKLEKTEKEFSYQRNQCIKCRSKRKHALVLTKEFPISVTEKKCCGCKEIKLASNFNRSKRRHDGLTQYCKECRSKTHKKEYKIKAEYYRRKSAAYYLKVAGTEEFKKKNNERQKQKLKEDPKYLLIRRLRNRLYYAFKKNSWKKNTKFSEYIGCSLEELKTHIEAKFQEGMSWYNQGEWHIDHIIPLDSAQTEEELYKLSHYTNLQPLWGEDNWKKGNKIK